MNLQQLYYFKAIAELEHYTRASEQLSVSQSSLSHAIAGLEDELNVKLFARKGRNVVLTKYGRLMLPYVSKSLETLETGMDKLSDFISPETGTVSIACFPSLAQFVPEIIVRYISETNRVNVRLQSNQEATYSALRDQLLAGNVDMVFATEIDDPRIGSAFIGEHELVLLVPPSHPLAQRESVDLRELDGEDFIAFDHSAQIRAQLDNIFDCLQIHPNIRMESGQDVIIYGLVAASHGVAIVPYPLGGAPYHVKIVRIAGGLLPARRLYLSWNKEEYMPPAAEYFRDFIVNHGPVFDEFLHRNHKRICQ